MSGRRSSLISYNTQSYSSKSLSEYGFDIESLTDAKLIGLVNKLKDEIRILKLENEILEKTIMRVEPALMQGVYHVLEYAMKRNSSSSLNIGSLTKSPTLKYGRTESLFCSSRMMTTNPSRVSIRKLSSRISGTVIYGSGPRINVIEMVELVSIEIKIQNTNLENVRNEASKQLGYMNAQLEEIEIKVSATKKTRNIFKQVVLIDGWDKIAQRIPAEAWIRFITDSVKRSDRKIDKLRLRTSTLNTQFRKFNDYLKFKSELSLSLRPVDFEKLKIENSECLKVLENKNEQLKESKKMNGDANLNLAIHKKAFLEQTSYLNKVMVTTQKKEQQTVKLDKERELTQIQANILSHKLDEIRKIRMAHQVPNVMDYVEVKGAINSLKHAIKILENRAKIQRHALTVANKKLHMLSIEKEKEEKEKIKTST